MQLEDILRLAAQYEAISPERILLSGKIGDTTADRRAIATQVALRGALMRKLPTWAEQRVYIPQALNLEQSSSEATALSKGQYLSEQDTVLDLTGGLGVDFWAMALRARYAVYVEQDEDLFLASQYNLPKLLPQHRYQMYRGDAMAMLDQLLELHRPSLIYLDPARRAEQKADRRVYAIEDCSPSLYEVIERLRTLPYPPPRILAKLSPMLDVKHCLEHLAGVVAVEVVALQGEVKELLLDIRLDAPRLSPTEVSLWARHIQSQLPQSLYQGTYGAESQPCPIASTLGAYIYEPNGAILKLGMYRQVGRSYDLQKLHEHTHLYSSDNLRSDFPGRIFELIELIPYRSKHIKGLHKVIDGAQITCRNFPISSESLRHKLKLRESHERSLIATTLHDGSHALLLCRRVQNE